MVLRLSLRAMVARARRIEVSEPRTPMTRGLHEVSSADVAIVGAGPTGLALAILLAQRGRSVVVLEQPRRAATGGEPSCDRLRP